MLIKVDRVLINSSLLRLNKINGLIIQIKAQMQAQINGLRMLKG